MTMQNIFPFFHLPRELRDFIYEESLITFEEQRMSQLQIRATDVPPTNLLLVSHQLHDELTLYARTRSKLLIYDHVQFHAQSERLPPAALHTSNLRAFIYLGASDRRTMGDWGFIPKATRHMPNLKSVTLQILADECSDHWRKAEFKVLNKFCARFARFYDFRAEMAIEKGCENDDKFWDPDVVHEPAMVWSDEEQKLIWVAEEAPTFRFYNVVSGSPGCSARDSKCGLQ
ncbi:hypothetical protein BU23DRAFT_30083 [Bimuria novae-zelandiae CBS 107.79]|uniref:Uncharacterized protein n=1 Tax=Bimuria novae-zelandiae CBS 107.79 TaxID=1447943 RepID=A0A6A5VTK9_9PLEO|nr:hypothetical protein BU23DRAFT_30083 [Bimuria novae-zelandiae CBS 107.79]